MKTIKNIKTAKRIRLKKKIRAKIFGTSSVPRLSVFRSNAHIYAQLIDDNSATTIVSSSDTKLKGKNVEKAIMVGKEIAKSALEKNISKIIFDRNGFKFTGRIKALADSARSAGLNF